MIEQLQKYFAAPLERAGVFSRVPIILEDALSTAARAGEALARGAGRCVIVRRPALRFAGLSPGGAPAWEVETIELEFYESAAGREAPAGADAPGAYDLALSAAELFARAYPREVSLEGIREEKDESGGICSALLTLRSSVRFTPTAL